MIFINFIFLNSDFNLFPFFNSTAILVSTQLLSLLSKAYWSYCAPLHEELFVTQKVSSNDYNVCEGVKKLFKNIILSTKALKMVRLERLPSHIQVCSFFLDQFLLRVLITLS